MDIKKTIANLLGKKVVQNGIWLFILQIANTLLPLITIPYVTRILGAMGYGHFSLAYNWITYCQVIVEYGFAMSGARSIAIDPDNHEKVSETFSVIIVSRTVLLATVIIGLCILAQFFSATKEHWSNVATLMSIVISVVLQMNWLFQGKQQMQFITIINVISRTASVFLVYLLVRKAEDVNLYAFCYSFTFIISSLLGLWTAIRRFHLSFHLPSLSMVIAELKDGWYLFASAAISRLFGSLGITILGAYAAVEAVGSYSAIYKIPYILSMLFSPIGQALFPYMSNSIAKDRSNALRKQQKIFLPIIMFFAVAGIGIILLRKWIVSIVLGKAYIGYSDLLLLMMPQIVLGIINNFLGVQSLVAGGYQKQYSHAIIISIAILVCSNLVLCPTLDAYGTAASALLSEAILTVLLFGNCRKYFWNTKGSCQS